MRHSRPFYCHIFYSLKTWLRCNSLFLNLPQYQLGRLQINLSSAARVSKTPKFRHISLVLKYLQWLNIEQHTKYKLIHHLQNSSIGKTFVSLKVILHSVFWHCQSTTSFRWFSSRQVIEILHSSCSIHVYTGTLYSCFSNSPLAMPSSQSRFTLNLTLWSIFFSFACSKQLMPVM